MVSSIFLTSSGESPFFSAIYFISSSINFGGSPSALFLFSWAWSLVGEKTTRARAETINIPQIFF
jgi:hypothetical protein